MSKLNPVTADVGVLIGRFQVHELHEAHVELIESVQERHDRTLIFIGLSPLRNTTRNPLDFNTRKRMIQESFPNVEVYYVEDRASDGVWSADLDRELSKWLKPHQTAILYGSRDSFIDRYSGKFPTVELESKTHISGTEIRRRIANTFSPSKEFRAGVISASYNRYPMCNMTVDVAIIRDSQVLMGRKSNESKFRFIGGFTSPESPSLESDVRREVTEEASVEVDNITYIGSCVIDDWRFRSEVDKIKTAFFAATYVFGRPEAGDDIAEVTWMDISQLDGNTVVAEHLPLVGMFKHWYNR